MLLYDVNILLFLDVVTSLNLGMILPILFEPQLNCIVKSRCLEGYINRFNCFYNKSWILFNNKIIGYIYILSLFAYLKTRNVILYTKYLDILHLSYLYCMDNTFIASTSIFQYFFSNRSTHFVFLKIQNYLYQN